MEGVWVLTDIKHEQYQFVYEILRHGTAALDFTISLLEESYKSHFPDHIDDVTPLLNNAWNHLLDARSGDGLYRACEEVHRRFFKAGDSGSWFSRGYSSYKSQRKPVQDFDNLVGAITGSTVLDFGTGRGHLAVLIARAGFDCYTTDVMDYRCPDACGLPFQQMTSPHDVPYADDMFDSAIVKTVLHHVDATDLTPLLTNLRRVARRLVIEEDTYAVPTELLQSSARQPEIVQFNKLNHRDQFRVLALVDFFGNAVVQGLVEMNFGWQFKRVGEWNALFGSLGFHVSDTEIVGFRPGNVHKSCQVRFVVDRE